MLQVDYDAFAQKWRVYNVEKPIPEVILVLVDQADILVALDDLAITIDNLIELLGGEIE